MVNAITSVKIKDYLVFKGEFSAEFCPGINVLIGANGTGKTTLLKLIYLVKYESGRKQSNSKSPLYTKELAIAEALPSYDLAENSLSHTEALVFSATDDPMNPVYIPEKDMLSNAKGLPETVEYGKLQFEITDIAIIKQARVASSVPEQPLYRKICEVIGGTPENDGESFFMKRDNVDEPIPFALEASGHRKLGLLATLIRNEQIKSGTVLFWDEPENSLNPELIPTLVNILFELQRGGVQIFIATHSKMLANEFSISRKDNDEVKFFSLYKSEDGSIKADTDSRFDLLKPNKLTQASVEQYEREIERGLGCND